MSQKSTGSDLMLPGIIAAALAVIGYFTYRPPLESVRPQFNLPKEEFPQPSATPLRRLPSRMWEDPLLVSSAAAQGESAVGAAPSLYDVQEVLRDLASSASRVICLPVMVPGDASSDSHEQRMRMRYAVSAALFERSFHATDNDQICYVDIDLIVHGLRPSQKLLPTSERLRIPLNIYVRNRTREYAVLCWIDEDRLGKRPLAALLQITQSLFSASERDQTSIRILGPAQSDTNKRIWGELKQSARRLVAATKQWQCVGIWSARATIESTKPEEVSSHYRLAGITNHSVIGTDTELETALTRELRLRGALPVRPHERLVLLTEKDTSYGRWWRNNTFHDLRTSERGDSVLVYSFLRGIDGRGGQLSKPPDDTRSSTRSALAAADPPRTGPSQFDYLTRVEEEIVRLQYEGIRITAVGVVGSDVYDKLLVLRALRQRLPNTCFFTTDLDVELWRPDELPYTRNLIVASHYGLSLHPGYVAAIQPRDDDRRQAAEKTTAHETPPFRDGYQTSLFRAGLLALDNLAPDPNGSGSLIFEICRRGPYHLQTNAPSASVSSVPLHPPTDRNVDAGWYGSSWPLLIVTVAAGLGFLSLAGVQFVRQPVLRVRDSWAAVGLGWWPSPASHGWELKAAWAHLLVICAISLPITSLGYLWIRRSSLGVIPLLVVAAYAIILFAVARRRRDAATSTEPPAVGWAGHFLVFACLVACLVFPLLPTGFFISTPSPHPELIPIVIALLVVGVVGGYIALPKAYRQLAAESLITNLRCTDAPAKDRPLLQRTPIATWLVLAQLCLVMVILLVMYDHIREGGEPFTLCGISLWPITLSRALLFVVAIVLIAQCFSDLDKNARQLRDRYFKIPPAGTWGDFLEESSFQKPDYPAMPLVWMFLAFAFSLLAVTAFPALPYRGVVNYVVSVAVMYMVLVSMCLLTFVVFVAICNAREHVKQLFDCLQGVLNQRVSPRLFPPQQALVLTARELQERAPQVTSESGLGPSTEVRHLDELGHDSRTLHFLPEEVAAQAAEEWHFSSPPHDAVKCGLKHLTALRLVGERTRVLGKLLQYPAVVVLCVILIHLTWLDRLDVSPQVLLVVGLLLILPISFYARLRRDAERLRQTCFHHLRRESMRILNDDSSKDAARRLPQEQLQRLEREIEREDRGVFGPVLRDPIFKALAIPLGGTGGLVLLQEAFRFLQR